MDNRTSEETARKRWLLINAARIGGVAITVLGILIATGRIAGPAWSGYLLLALGLLDVFVVPQVLIRKWKTPPG